MRQSVRERALVQQFMYIMKTEKKYLHIQVVFAGLQKKQRQRQRLILL